MPSSAGSGKSDFREQGQLERDVDILRDALQLLDSSLPSTWTLAVEVNVEQDGVEFDALATLTAPDGSTVVLAVEVKRSIVARDVPYVLAQLRSRMRQAAIPLAVPMLVARYLSASVREQLDSRGAAYVDATGNLRLAIERPSLFVRNVGADHDPWRGRGRPRGSLRGAPAARVVRALVDFPPPYTVPKLVKLSGTSTGATYRVIEFLEEEGLIQRQSRGPVTNVAWRRLIERWSQDYGFQRSDVVQSFLFPRGVEQVPDALRSSGGDYVLTGSLAARRYAAHAPPRLAMVYVADVNDVVERLGLRPVERGANVILAANRDDVSFVRTKTFDGLITAALSQIAVDLLTGPGRLPSEGGALLDWMTTHEPHWRH